MPEQKIDDVTIRCEKLPAREAQRLLLRLGKMLGPALESVAYLQSVSGDEDVERVTAAILGDVLAKADVDQADALLTQLIEAAQIKSVKSGGYEPIVFDHHFQDNLIGAWKVAGFVLKVNFADFFGAATDSIFGAMAATSRQSRNSNA